MLVWTDAVKSDLKKMIAVSDNDAANRLMDLAGMARVNQTLASYGLQHSRLYNHFALVDAPKTTGFNQTSAADLAHLLELLANGKLVNDGASEEMRSLLATTEDDTKLVRPLPAGVRVE